MKRLISFVAVLVSASAAHAVATPWIGAEVYTNSGTQDYQRRTTDYSGSGLRMSLAERITEPDAPINIDLGIGVSLGSSPLFKASPVSFTGLSPQEQLEAGTPHGYHLNLPSKSVDFLARITYPLTGDRTINFLMRGEANVYLDMPKSISVDDGSTVSMSNGKVGGSVGIGLMYEPSKYFSVHGMWVEHIYPDLHVNFPCLGMACPNGDIGKPISTGFEFGAQLRY